MSPVRKQSTNEARNEIVVHLMGLIRCMGFKYVVHRLVVCSNFPTCNFWKCNYIMGAQHLNMEFYGNSRSRAAFR